MKIMKYTLVCAFVAIVGFAHAADEIPAAGNNDFHPKINAWAEGTLMSIDADGAKFTIRGTKRPYASVYAKMRKEIYDKTANLNAADSEKKANEIRAAWQPKLEKMRSEDPGKDSDFTFHLPAKDGKFTYFDESAYYGTSTPRTGNTDHPVTLTPAERNAMMALGDLKVGQFVVVGYEAGTIYNDAYVVIKANKPVGGLFRESETVPKAALDIPRAVVIDPDTETARQIRKALVEDKSLSTAAHNVNIKVENGVAHLKGSVKSETEKSVVEQKASDVAGSSKVMSHLKVSAK